MRDVYLEQNSVLEKLHYYCSTNIPDGGKRKRDTHTHMFLHNSATQG
jgi:hypothetical protein